MTQNKIIYNIKKEAKNNNIVQISKEQEKGKSFFIAHCFVKVCNKTVHEMMFFDKEATNKQVKNYFDKLISANPIN
jgi:hypothetical protein